ncbi:hypothetical protein K227x_55910 [Rubripirellula lacrimiformis]|uniref:Uncharacterized protein n=1 Tax=Rubripirellula lacrimiformis TaxID=1930273 RepID=A0A517NJ58_9BACT|nr:hypothetical protein K227x_55910 [Rubripirellula lacrimiformis]
MKDVSHTKGRQGKGRNKLPLQTGRQPSDRRSIPGGDLRWDDWNCEGGAANVQSAAGRSPKYTSMDQPILATGSMSWINEPSIDATTYFPISIVRATLKFQSAEVPAEISCRCRSVRQWNRTNGAAGQTSSTQSMFGGGIEADGKCVAWGTRPRVRPDNDQTCVVVEFVQIRDRRVAIVRFWRIPLRQFR